MLSPEQNKPLRKDRRHCSKSIDNIDILCSVDCYGEFIRILLYAKSGCLTQRYYGQTRIVHGKWTFTDPLVIMDYISSYFYYPLFIPSDREVYAQLLEVFSDLCKIREKVNASGYSNQSFRQLEDMIVDNVCKHKSAEGDIGFLDIFCAAIIVELVQKAGNIRFGTYTFERYTRLLFQHHILHSYYSVSDNRF